MLDRAGHASIAWPFIRSIMPSAQMYRDPSDVNRFSFYSLLARLLSWLRQSAWRYLAVPLAVGLTTLALALPVERLNSSARAKARA